MCLLLKAGLPLELSHQSIRSREKEAKILVVVYQGVIVNDATPISIP